MSNANHVHKWTLKKKKHNVKRLKFLFPSLCFCLWKWLCPRRVLALQVWKTWRTLTQGRVQVIPNNLNNLSRIGSAELEQEISGKRSTWSTSWSDLHSPHNSHSTHAAHSTRVTLTEVVSKLAAVKIKSSSLFWLFFCLKQANIVTFFFFFSNCDV